MSSLKGKLFASALAAALALAGAAVCAAAAQSKSARRRAGASKKVAAATAKATPAQATPAADTHNDDAATQPAESAPAKRNARGEEKSDARTAAPSEAPAKGAGDAKPADARTDDSAAKESDAAEAQYVYEFENPDFVINRIHVEHDAQGRGRITFERRSYTEPVVEPLKLSAAAWERVRAGWEALRFLDSEESYQAEKQFPHLGVTRLKLRAGGRERATEFNYTTRAEARTLAAEYRRAADQAIFVFDLGVARESQPLEAPKLLEGLERMLKYNLVSDPEQLVPVLSELQTDERLPLIARNHAARILKKLQKK